MLVEAGAFISAFGDKAADETQPYMKRDSLYADVADRINERVYQGQEDPSAMPADQVAQQILRALRKKHPPWRVAVGGNCRKYLFFAFIQKWISPGIIQKVLEKRFGLQELKRSVMGGPPDANDKRPKSNGGYVSLDSDHGGVHQAPADH